MIRKTTNYSLYTILSTIMVIVVFVVNLSASDSKFKRKENLHPENISIKDTIVAKNIQGNKEKIIGAWTHSDTENASIAFYKDSVLYVDALKYYKYEVSENTLIRYFDSLTDTSLILKLNEDSLVIESKYMTEKYERFKK